jgi:hypothetical protein
MRGTRIPEKRQSRRFSLKLPIAVKGAVAVQKVAAQKTETENVSSGGVMFCVDAALKVGSSVAFSIRMPADLLGVPQDVLVNGTGRVVRCNRRKRREAVAVVIDDYVFERC